MSKSAKRKLHDAKKNEKLKETTLIQKSPGFQIQPTSCADQIFGPKNMSLFVPKFDDIPNEFKNYHSQPNPWMAVSKQWFYKGLESFDYTPKENVNKDQALGHLKAILGCFSISHEHKHGACAYLLSLWFNP